MVYGLLIFLTLLNHVHGATARPELRAVEIVGKLQGTPDFADPLWQRADAEVQSLRAPSNIVFAHPPEKTNVRILWSKDSLFVRFDCQDRSIVFLPGTDTKSAPRDEPYYKADSVEVFLDPVGDAHMYMEFQFSPNNGVFDAAYFCTTLPESGPDFFLKPEVIERNIFFIKEWNLEGLRAQVQVWPVSQGAGWSVIAAFPAKPILQRLGKTEFSAGMRLKINFVRFDYFAQPGPKFDITNWAPVLAGCAHVSPAGMGTIVLGSHP